VTSESLVAAATILAFGLIVLGVGVLEAFPIIALGLAFYLLLVVANVPALLTHMSK
jgi:hypothetical protein